MIANYFQFLRKTILCHFVLFYQINMLQLWVPFLECHFSWYQHAHSFSTFIFCTNVNFSEWIIYPDIHNVWNLGPESPDLNYKAATLWLSLIDCFVIFCYIVGFFLVIFCFSDCAPLWLCLDTFVVAVLARSDNSYFRLCLLSWFLYEHPLVFGGFTFFFHYHTLCHSLWDHAQWTWVVPQLACKVD